MSKYDMSGVHVLNKFIWDRLKEEGLMDAADYGGLYPFIPSQQIPTFNDLSKGKPFIVYTYSTMNGSENFWESHEQAVLRVYSDNEKQLRNITHFMVDLLNRYDWTAKEVNEFIAGVTGDEDEKGFDFKYVQVIASIGPEPFEQEGGRQATVITLKYCYTHNLQGTPEQTGQGMRS